MSVRPSRPDTIKAARFALFGVITLAILASAACGNERGPEQNDPNLWTWSGAIAEPGVLHLRNINGAINVTPSPDGNVHVTASARWHRGDPKTDLKFQSVSSGGDVTVCVFWGDGTCTAKDYNTKAEILGKKGTDANVTLTVQVPARVRVDAVTVNGGIDVQATAPITAKTVNGSLKLATAVGPIDAENVNGSIDARMTTVGFPGPITVKAINGTASLFVPADVAGTFAVETMNGAAVSEFGGNAESNHKTTGTIGAGGREISVKSLNGRAELRKLNADGTVPGKN
jgi:hypothetical protein